MNTLHFKINQCMLLESPNSGKDVMVGLPSSYVISHWKYLLFYNIVFVFGFIQYFLVDRKSSYNNLNCLSQHFSPLLCQVIFLSERHLEILAEKG